MRIAIIADSHFDETSRFSECIRLHDFIANDIEQRHVDVVFHAGDVFERKSTPAERRAVAQWLTRIAELAPVVIVRGNHDAVGDLSIFARLRTKFPIKVEEACGVHVVNGVAVACLAWPRKAELLARIGSPVSIEGGGHIAAEALRAVLRGMRAEMEQHDGPRVLLAHAMVRGSVTSTGQPLVGCDMEIGLEDLALAGADLVAIGHIHKGQAWDWGGVPVIYPGSPRRTAFGELEAKGYVVADFAAKPGDGRDMWWCNSWERVEAPATRMLLVETTWNDGFHGGPLAYFDSTRQPAEIRFRYAVDSDKREAARADAAFWADVWRQCGALSVKVEEEVRANVRARAPEIAAAKTLPEKLRALWSARGVAMDDLRATRVLGRLPDLEEAA